MKLLHQVNKWSFIITLIFYLTIYFGLIAQIGLGIIQVFISILVGLSIQRLPVQIRRQLFGYWILVLLYLTTFWLSQSINWMYGILGIVFIILIPMSIGGFFLYITHQIKTLKNEI